MNAAGSLSGREPDIEGQSMTDVSFHAQAFEPKGVQPACIAPDPAELDCLTSKAMEQLSVGIEIAAKPPH